jgi:hypothetical protein
MDLFDTRDGKRIGAVKSVPPWASFAPKRRLIITDTANETSTVWQLPEGTAKWVFTNKVSAFQVARFSPDENFILTDERHDMKLWRFDGDELKLEKAFNPKRSPVSGTAFSPDGHLAATGEEGGLIKLWSIPACESIGVLTGHTRDVISLAFSPDGRTLASMCDDRTFRLWHVATQRELLRFQTTQEDQSQFSLVFSPDGRALAARRFDKQGPITWVWFAPSLAEIAVAEGRDYRAETGQDPARWLAVAKMLRQKNRPEEALEAFAQVLQLTAREGVRFSIKTDALQSRADLLKSLGRIEKSGTDNCAVLGILARSPATPAEMIDLSAFYNASFDGSFSTVLDNNLCSLPQGIQAFADTQFDVRGEIAVYYHLQDQNYPESIEGIPVRRRARSLHFLHAAGGKSQGVATGEPIGFYRLRFANGQVEDIPILYNQNTSDWWEHEHLPKALPDARLAWRGSSTVVKPDSVNTVRLFNFTWNNPFPDIEIVSFDLFATQQQTRPFLIAVTAE